MEKVVISREDLKSYPENKVQLKLYHRLRKHRKLSDKSIITTVKFLHKVMTDSNASK